MRRKKQPKRSPVIACILACIFVTCVMIFGTVFALRFHEMFPSAALKYGEKITAYIAEVTAPIRMVRLSLLKPDAVLLMPVYGVEMRSVSDSWGSPRPGERSHEGQDIFAPRGTPVFSATPGFVRRIGSGTALGGHTVYITGAGGRRYYYAHFDRVASGLKVGMEVTPDTVLGFVGNSGNAANTPPHLHFGMYQGRTAVNPYALLTDRW